ncbi:MAG: polyprenol monophosphomannose synthase [Candidatus Marsarchaeota archaeon]|nr:polyprenol monophosphomannose synthase [Candidatus Marsarchaeota archaeon]
MASPRFSVILPTYNEAESLPKVVGNIRSVCRKNGWASKEFDILVVDDNSPDNTAALARRLGARVLLRKNKRGLASAILDGFLAARSPFVFVMDADGQHDLANFPKMLNLLLSNQADLVMASRHVGGGRMKMGPLRRTISWGAGLLARPLLGSLSDPMSGFFGMRRAPLLRVKRWSLIGFKLLPEIVVRCPSLRVKEVPLAFKPRIGGESKMNSREVLDYLRLLLALYVFRLGGLG